MEEGICRSDVLREWIRVYEPGSEVHSKHPLQSAIALSCVCDEAAQLDWGIQNQFDIALTSICKTMELQFNDAISPKESIFGDGEVPFSNLLTRMSDDNEATKFLSLGNAVDLANEMNVVLEASWCDNNSTPPSFIVQAPAPQAAVPSAPVSVSTSSASLHKATLSQLVQQKPPVSTNSITGNKRNHQNSRSSDLVEIEEKIADPPKPNPFKSAKDQFVTEGGVLSKLNAATASRKVSGGTNSNSGSKSNNQNVVDDDLPPELAMFEKALIERIEADIMHSGARVKFDDIAGLSFAKKCVNELICWPMARPDLFQGLRSLPKGILLFGPPGTGKTLIGKAIASQVGATFFNISASSLTSKWIGEGERTVRALFVMARLREPSVVFVDEVDSLLTQRSSEENEASRRIKTEFLVQLDGAATTEDIRVVIIGATNRPEEIDEAARRRFVKRIYIPLPDEEGRKQLLETLLKDNHAANNSSRESSDIDIDELTDRTDGFSGADIRSLVSEAAMGPLRELALQHGGNLQSVAAAHVGAVCKRHFEAALETVAPSVSPHDLTRHLQWNQQFGSFRKLE